MNMPTRKINVYTSESAIVIYKSDTVVTQNNVAKLEVLRSKDSLKLIVKTDSQSQLLKVASKNSFFYWFNIIQNYGIGMMVDRKNPKRYTYKGKLYVNFSDSVFRINPFEDKNRKGNEYFHISLPHFNVFQFKPSDSKRIENAGFWGLSLGYEYYYSDKAYVGFYGDAVTDIFIAVPAPIDYEGAVESMGSAYLSLTNNHRLGRLSLGYGLSYGVNYWQLRYERTPVLPPGAEEPFRINYSVLGSIINIRYQLSKRFHLGIKYRPTFFQFRTENKYSFEQLYSLDLAWKIKL